MINPKIATILGMEIPEEVADNNEVIVVEPHEIVSIDNKSLPPMHDLERKALQAEKELQMIIDSALGYQKELFEEATSVEPRLRNRYIEVANGTMNTALDAIKAKMKSIEDRRKGRLKEAEFTRPNESSNGSTNNFFIGSREELLSIMNDDDQENN